MPKNEKKLFVSVFTSRKSGNKTYALILDLGYSRKYLSFDIQLIAEVLGLRVVDLYDIELGEYTILDANLS